MEQLIEKIKKWGYDRNINTANPLMQTTKTLEEVIELQQAIINYENKCNCDNCTCINKIKDAIGDIFITLIILSIQDNKIKYKLNKVTCNCWFSPFKETTYIFDCISCIQCCMLEKDYTEVDFSINEIIATLKLISESYNLSFIECVEHAYNEIKDRKGKMINGLWVKESNYECR